MQISPGKLFEHGNGGKDMAAGASAGNNNSRSNGELGQGQALLNSCYELVAPGGVLSRSRDERGLSIERKGKANRCATIGRQP